MPRSRSTLISFLALLAAFAAASRPAQAVDDIRFEALPSLDKPPPTSSAELSLQPPPFLDRSSGSATAEPSPPPPEQSGPGDDKSSEGKLITLDESKAAEEPVCVSLYDFLGYRYSTNSLDWIPGGGNDFGVFSIVSDPYTKSGIAHDVVVGMAFNSLSGPVETDMPAWVFDFSIGYQIRQRLGPLAFDVATAVCAASDFKGNARKGILFPSHAVAYLSIAPATDLVFGVDYLDRGDVKILPVGGLILVPDPAMRFELVFPRPRATLQLNETHRLYVAGELGGGTWAIERVSLDDDLATYRDLRVCVGVEDIQKDGSRTAFEIGYLFNRHIEYTSGIGDMNLNDAVLLRLVTRH